MAFNSPGGLSLNEGYLNLSFNNREAWSKLIYAEHEIATPKMIFLGDETAGPMLFLNAIGPGIEGVKTATHYHGSDQFRLIVRGVEQSVNRLTFHPGEFAFQEAGMPYKEGSGGAEEVWGYLVLGDRRGAAATMPLGDNSTHKVEMTPERIEEMTQSFSLFTEMAKTNPGGPKGNPSVASTLGHCRNGFLRGSFTELKDARKLSDGVRAAGGLWGDRSSGPAQLIIKAEANNIATPSFTADTEVVMLLVGGSCTIGESHYFPGDLRIQAAGIFQEATVAGPTGAEIIFMIADRRAMPIFAADNDIDTKWGQSFKTIITELEQLLH
jgi:hypothetical protein